MRTRVIWVQSHARRLPNKVETPPHLELVQAFERDQYMAWVEEQITAEFDREFREGMR